MTNYTYELRAHSRDIVDYDWLGTVSKHSGYDLITYKDGVAIYIESIDLVKNKSKKIEFNIVKQIVEQHLLAETGIIHGLCVNDGGDSIFVTPEWLIENNYDTSKTPLLKGQSALEAFNKIKLEANILNFFTNIMDYYLIEQNCNASTDYFAERYLNGMNVFSDLSGIHVGDALHFEKFFNPIETLYYNEGLTKTINSLDKFYEEIRGTNFDINKATSDVIDKGDGFTLSITDGNSSYIFDDDTTGDILGTRGDDVVYLGLGNDVVETGSGNDIVYGYKENMTALEKRQSIFGKKEINLGAGNDDLVCFYLNTTRDCVYLSN